MEQKKKFASGEAKVQAIGKDTNGQVRYMIYLSKKLSEFLDLNKGNTVGFNLWLQERTKTIKQNSSVPKSNLVSATPQPQKTSESEEKTSILPISIISAEPTEIKDKEICQPLNESESEILNLIINCPNENTKKFYIQKAREELSQERFKKLMEEIDET